MTIPDLELSPHVAFSLANAIARRRGLTLFCGPTGAGKTATVAALLERLTGRRVVALGDVTTAALPSVDTDCVVEVGDVRSPDVAQIATELAGRALVLAVIRSGRSNSAIDRLFDMGLSKSILKRADPVVVTQQLCRRLCRNCRFASHAEEESLRYLGISATQLGLTSGYVYEAAGCDRCSDGYSGCVPIFEVLVAGGGISEGVDLRSEGSLLDDGLLKVLAGHTTLAELRRVL
jgi:type II secretory ATPase GspE/PulE/Tfp pilus assembly ATPase PilB-like protein